MENKINVDKKLVHEAAIYLLIANYIVMFLGIIILILTLIIKPESSIINGTLFGISIAFIIIPLVDIITMYLKINKYKNLNSYIVYDINDNYIEISNYKNDNKINTSKYNFDKLVSYRKTKNYYFVYINKQLYIPLYIKDENRIKEIINKYNIKKRFF